MVNLRIPIATYRIQFNDGFPFKEAQSIVSYLHGLGITELYSSPILKARQGSSHGYDVTDPAMINPDLGTEQEFDSLVRELKNHGMGLLLDIVPNHMAATPENPWWMDVLEQGRASPYAEFFDIDWDSSDPVKKNKIILPVLVSDYKNALKEGDFLLIFDKTGLSVDYRGYRLPLNIKSYPMVIRYLFDELEEGFWIQDPAFFQLEKLINAIEKLPVPDTRNAAGIREGYDEQQRIKEDFRQLINTSTVLMSFLSENLVLVNSDKLNSDTFEFLDGLLSQQYYRLVFWKDAQKDLNYRRFFDINELIGVRVENPLVFQATHNLVFRLVQQGKITGLRIDHIDGLYDPLEYLSRLQYHLGGRAKCPVDKPDFYVVVEKILEGNEVLPVEWPVYGTTGYDFLKTLNSVFVDEGGFREVKDVYSRFTGSNSTFNEVVYRKKKQVMEEIFASDINLLVQRLSRLAVQGCYISDCMSLEVLKKILIEVTACLPVYRTYISSPIVSYRDRLYVEYSFEQVQQQNSHIESSVLEFVRGILLLEFPDNLNSRCRKEWLHFVMRWQQCTGAVMAMGVEDTVFYNYNPLISLNEVGANPGEISSPVDAFHYNNLCARAQRPYGLTSTATHDTKRGEDVRTRINVLSEMPREWEIRLARWIKWNYKNKKRVNRQLVPDHNMEIFCYQTLLGAWPVSHKEILHFKERIKAYMLKVAREAKTCTSWISPSSEYERALTDFVEAILDNDPGNEFFKDFLEFQKPIAYYGALNSLAQVLLKITSPGVPDFYQGAELWDLSLVDPDNRGFIDYNKRRSFLDKLVKQESQDRTLLINDLLHSWRNGMIKLFVTYQALITRHTRRILFLEGDYIPLKVQGSKKEHICAFARRLDDLWALVVVPRLSSKLVRPGSLPLGRLTWKDQFLLLPKGCPQIWLNIFSGEVIRNSTEVDGVSLSRVFRKFPLGLLVNFYQNKNHYMAHI